MATCKKFKPSEGVSFVSKPLGDCANCVYFSADNCGTHRAEPDTNDAANFF